MEAAPRLPVISFALKTSLESPSFALKLKQYIAEFYREDPETFSPEISQLESLRANATRPSIDISGCQTLKKYYCQLLFLRSRFPMEKGESVAVPFQWHDPYNDGVCTLADIRFELMSILFNIGAIHSQLGAAENRTKPDGLKMACTHFQCAAWAYQQLRERNIHPPNVESIFDFNGTQFMNVICSAQAQECILEKSMLDNRKASIIAKIVVQTVNFYNDALKIMHKDGDDALVDTIGSKRFKEWLRLINFKKSYYTSISYFYHGQQSEEQQKMGERVAYYNAACDELEHARKLAKDVKQFKDELQDALSFTGDVIEGKRKIAKSENEFIYHETIPEQNTLEFVRGASLVKLIGFTCDDVSGQDIFHRLIPMEAHEAASVYSETKAQVLREYMTKCDEKNNELIAYLNSIQIDAIILAGRVVCDESSLDLPPDLIERLETFRKKPLGLDELVKAMSSLANIYHEVESTLDEIHLHLNEEETREKEYQTSVGARPPSIIASELKREAGKYKEAHLKASEANQLLRTAMISHVNNLKLAALPIDQLIVHIPTLIAADPNVDETFVRDIYRLYRKIEDMREQRGGLLARLRAALNDDDITKKILAKSTHESLDELFKAEIDKHKELEKLLDLNLAAQGNILTALNDALTKNGEKFQYLTAIAQQRSSGIQSLINSCDAFDELLAKAQKGVEFYQKLETNVSKILNKVKNTIKVQDEERDVIIAKTKETKENRTRLKEYLDAMKAKNEPGIRPAPVGSEKDATDVRGNAYYDSYGSESSGSMVSGQYPIGNVSYHTGQVSMQNPGGYGSNVGSIISSTTTAYNPTVSSVVNAMGGLSMNPIVSQAAYPSYNLTNSPMPPNTSMLANPSYSSTNHTVNLPAQNPVMNQSNMYNPTFNPNQMANQTPNSTIGQINNQATIQMISQPNLTGYPSSSYTPAFNYGTQSNSTDTSSYLNQLNQPNQTNVIYSQYNESSSYPSVAYTAPFHSISNTNTMYTAQYAPYSFSTENPTVNSYLSTGYDANYATGQNYSNTHLNNQPNYRPEDLTYNVMPNINPQMSVNSPDVVHYTSAGQNFTTQIPSSEKYPSDTSVSVGNYYSNPYGYQGNEINPNFYASNVHQTQMSGQFLNSSTYMTSSNVNLQTNNTLIGSKPASNVDLLADIDFNVVHEPLKPEKSATVINLPAKVEVPEKSQTEPKPTPKPIQIEPLTVTRPEPKKPTKKDVLSDKETLAQFINDVDSFEKFVNNLSMKTLNGPTPLDLKWSELQDSQDKQAHAFNISVARCYPMKNRFADILPFDHSRVELPGTKDDYINASHVVDLTPTCPPFIFTQWPLPSTYVDFWTMVQQQQSEIIVCLLSDGQMNNQTYWPLEKNHDMSVGPYKITLQSINHKPHWTERVIQMTTFEPKQSRCIVHMQFHAWPASIFPATPGPLLNFVGDVLTYYDQQRSREHAIIVHCESGIGRSGVFCALAAILTDPAPVHDVIALVERMSRSRKQAIRDREHLKFLFHAVLYHYQDLLMQRGILSTRPKFDDASVKRRTHSRHPSQDLLLAGASVDGETSAGVDGNKGKATSNDPLSQLDPFWTLKK